MSVPIDDPECHGVPRRRGPTLDARLDWIEIDPCVMTLRSDSLGARGGGASIEFAAKSLLVDHAGTSGVAAVGFEITIDLPDPHASSPIRHIRGCGFYGSLETFRDELRALRQDALRPATFDVPGLRLVFEPVEPGDLSRVLVRGELSPVVPVDYAGWPRDRNVLMKMFRDIEAPYRVEFAFLLLPLDSPRLDDFRRELQRLIAEVDFWNE